MHPFSESYYRMYSVKRREYTTKVENTVLEPETGSPLMRPRAAWGEGGCGGSGARYFT